MVSYLRCPRIASCSRDWRRTKRKIKTGDSRSSQWEDVVDSPVTTQSWAAVCEKRLPAGTIHTLLRSSAPRGPRHGAAENRVTWLARGTGGRGPKATMGRITGSAEGWGLLGSVVAGSGSASQLETGQPGHSPPICSIKNRKHLHPQTWSEVVHICTTLLLGAQEAGLPRAKSGGCCKVLTIHQSQALSTGPKKACSTGPPSYVSP